MKKILLALAAFYAVCACEHKIVTTTDFNVVLDSENTYVAGQPVVFRFDGDVDNIQFYSGEPGHEYQHKDRFSVDMTAVKGVELSLDIQARYGSADALDIYVTNQFEGLSGNDGEADRAMVRSILQNEMDGWTKLEFEEGKSGVWTYNQYDCLASLKENFAMAFHWNPKEYIKDGVYQVQRTYWINGKLQLEIDNVRQTSIDLSELLFSTLVMNEQIEDPYHKNAGNGSIILNNQETADLIFQGVAAADSLDYAIDAWAFSTPLALNQISNDKGEVIKNQQNYLTSYSHTWVEPGTYTVTFVGTNSNYLDASSEVIELQITILEKL